jgi:dTDP-4-dehydrorhamnose 3,5-epimerase/CDP-3, 6-dideoxy-D-glycero-D-glycero-4-hexulose-5-epimerase
MKIKTTKINGLYIIDGLKFNDLRGDLIKPFSESFIKNTTFPINTEFKEVWFTKSHKNVVRAMHLQVGDHSCEKLVSVINGAVLDVILDVRQESETYGQIFEMELNDKNAISLYVPKGCAHGYKVLTNNSITMYMATEINVPKDDVGIRWDSFGYDWKINMPILSERDKNLPTFKNSVL